MNKYLNVNTIDDLKIIIINRLGKILIFATSEIFNQMQIKNILFFIIIILNIIYSYTIMKLLMRDMIKEPNENLYYNLVNEKNKNEEIVKYKTWAYESLMLIPVGIILCKKNEIIFINKKMKSYLNVKNENNIIGFNYEDLIISRSNKKNDNNFSKNDIRLKFEDKEFLGEEINLQGNEEDSLLNMIIIQDLNTEVQIEKLKNMLEQKSLIELGRNEMLSNLSHEFKTPVNVIYSTVQLLDLDKTQYNYEKSHEYNMIIKRNCDKLIRMINNFIDSTQFETNTINLDLKVINIVALVEDLTMSVLNFAKNKNIKVIFDTEEEEIYILADIDFIERIVLNILSNAIKYNRNNGNIFVNIKDKEEKVIIKVTDTGIGIPEEKLDKLFNRFERFDNNNLVHEEGTGLGLNIVKQMVDALNGEIKAISKINQGTTISVIFDKYNINEEQIIDTYDDMSRRVTMELSDI
ncbi:sensor histidine kinase [Terrisporobacter mayombei]|nr:HAMP domain-containing sensor histidine kinase [Terrisporobacter mayombei]